MISKNDKANTEKGFELLEQELLDKKCREVRNESCRAFNFPRPLTGIYEILGRVEDMYEQNIERIALSEFCLENQISWSSYLDLRKNLLSDSGTQAIKLTRKANKGSRGG